MIMRLRATWLSVCISIVSLGVNLTESIIDAVDKHREVIGIFLDLTQVFDSVSHDKLPRHLVI